MHVLFSSDKSVEPLRKRILRNYKSLFPKWHRPDPGRPDFYKGYLENTMPKGYELSTLSQRDDDEYTRAHEPYYYRPCIETAHGLAKYTREIQHKRHAVETRMVETHTSSKKQRSSQRGGALSAAALNAIMYTDALHDLGKEYKQWIFSHVDPSVIPPSSVQSRNITWTVAQSWLNLSGLTYAANFSSRVEDVVSRWRQCIADNNGEITICIDGFLRNMQWATPHELFRDTLLESMMLLILAYDNNIACKKLIIVDGCFNEIDGFYFYRHIQDYIEYLSGLIKGVVVVKTQVRPDYPQPRYLPMSINDTYVTLINGDKIPHNTNKDWIYITQNDLHTFHFPYVKGDFVRMFRECFKIADTATQRVLQNAVAANFFRDAYRIDLALQYNWVFITHDRLAFLLYSILAFINGHPNLGLFLSRDRQASGAMSTAPNASMPPGPPLLPQHIQCLVAQ